MLLSTPLLMLTNSQRASAGRVHLFLVMGDGMSK